MTVQELAERLRGENPPTVVDVREPEELEICKLEVAIHIPMGMIADRHQELSGNENLAILCKSGGRSGRVVTYLLGLGYPSVENVEGGITAWAEQIDPSIATY